ncbi:MAG: hypothetical protein ACTTJI_02750 [Capnocytophaga sp.]|uniref:hypothetical protein n=1 Tax=Capnocytophaga sp. TaxID=44737 RepID=UPI003FA1277B
MTRDNTIYFIENFPAYTYPIQTIYKQYRKSEGKSASWRSRVCDEELPSPLLTTNQ